MTALWAAYARHSRRRERRAARSGQRLDIQGLRMVAVLTVFANHLWGWPSGGFVGVDVFFVISGFLITGNLLRDAEKHGSVPFGKFYWNRVRRIVPAAAVVLILTVAAAFLLFLPFRAREVGVDAIWAFVFMSNWWFSYQQTDYFRAAADTVSPLQHYWSLSIEEQFYFVWPALIFVISVWVLRKSWTHQRRMQLAAATMGVVVALSLGWALYQTATDASAAYFNTFSRVWELGVGALLATAVGLLARIPSEVRPWLSWAGLGLIAASLALISDGGAGFPAPWALLPVVGAALVIAAGVGEEPEYQPFLRNPVSGYIGDISYSLYLVHWPVIVFAGTVMDGGLYYSITVLCIAFGLAVASYHGVENTLRKSDWVKIRDTARDVIDRQYQPERSSAYATIAALALIVVGLTAFTMRPDAYQQPTLPPAIVADAPDEVDPSVPEAPLGPLNTQLQGEIQQALQATEWPPLDPSMETVLANNVIPPEIGSCDPSEALCSWGDGPLRVVLVGDSIASTYANPLREIALTGRMQLINRTMGGCKFLDVQLQGNPNEPAITAECPGFIEDTINLINDVKPDVVVITNIYNDTHTLADGRVMGRGEWSSAMQRTVDRFRSSVGKVVWLSPNPRGPNPQECYGTRGSSPADCVARIDRRWTAQAYEEQTAAEASGGIWVDSRPWFCTDGLCPVFVGAIPARKDEGHMSPPYLSHIHQVIQETLTTAGVL